MTQPIKGWVLDPDAPRAPPQELWDQMSESERQQVVEQLPSEFPVSELQPPEGDRHWKELADARLTLSRWFKKGGRRIYISGNLPVYYPAENMFSPDVVAVADVDTHERDSWMVSKENGRGLDFAVEIIVSGRRRKDLHDNVERYAGLGISEYFVLDVPRQHLAAYRLPSRKSNSYERVVPQGGRYLSEVLGLYLFLQEGRLRFAASDADLPNPDELINKLERLATEGEQRYLKLEAQLAEEQRRREEAEAELDRLRALIGEKAKTDDG